MHKFCISVAAGGAMLLGGCASAPPSSPPGVLKVLYSRQSIDQSILKETPTEVRIVKRETTGKVVAEQAGLNILMLALGGGAGFSGFSKDSLKGERIEDTSDRANLQNPVSTTFVQALQTAVTEKMAQEKIGLDQSYRYPLIVGGGSANLIYDSLVGSEEPSYQLVLELGVYKRGENSVVMPARLVPCSERSDPPQPLAYWSESSYSPVRQELDRMLAACQQKVLADLPRLLKP